MAEKGFGVKEVNLIGASGTPTITSPNNLNLNANNVAISTNVSIGGTLSVTGNVSVGGTLTYEDVTNIDSVGLVTARTGVEIGDTSNTTYRVQRSLGSSATKCGIAFNSGGSLNLFTDSSGAGTSRISISNTGNIQFGTIGSIQFLLEDYVTHAGDTNTQYGFDGADSYVVKTGGSTRLAVNNSGANVVGALTVNGSALSIDPTTSDIQVAYELLSTSASGAGWRITGNGIVNTVNNPDLYLIRGQKYRFINNSGGTHPFRIQSDSSTAYATGVTNNNASSGNIDFVPQNDAPARLYYNCTNHGGMLGNIYLRGAGGNETNVGITTFNAPIEVQKNGVPAIISNYNNSKHIQMDVGSTGAGLQLTTGHHFAVNQQPYADRNTNNNLTERFRISSEGYVTKPATPAFSAKGSTDAISAQSPLPYDVTDYNNGNHFSTSTYKFTCPVSGYYYVTCHVVPTNFTTGNIELYIKNNSGSRFFLDRKVKTSNYSTNNFSVGGSRIISASANDTLWVEFNSISGSPTLEGSSHFGIILMA